ncbi:RNase adapter RapZ [Motiliproteus coralliicola]|uniref:RNase adapter RapZ n=1 Tax=Motiliproteus coralliicola TaxID=2283196 RepID=A0A369WER0_9GAMM|nr:RNase adapter RapZ [Motiliproteus coralliicola]RDE19783.1 RNase adapter RapZ [Motiliproteus coralliicola]
MRLVILSGRSGSGKSTALQALEDLGFYCIDNLPVGLLPSLTEQLQQQPIEDKSGVAISIDARNTIRGLEQFPSMYQQQIKDRIDCDILYLDATPTTLLKRFSSTRRRHPLSDGEKGLKQAIELEKQLLEPIADLADLTIDTTRLSLYELRDQIKIRVVGRASQELSLLFQSFGFKHGVPMDADLVFDARCLPNPYWDPQLRQYTGRDQAVCDYLDNQPMVAEMQADIARFIERWLPEFQHNNRSYLTVCIGCTGGQHRSVFLAERLAGHFQRTMHNVLVQHRELPTTG